VKVLDFGVAKTSNAAILGGTDANVTRAGELFGSPAYMAPEQARGREVDARTDLYSLGAVLFECATGSQLFQDASMVELLARHMAQEPDSPRRRAPSANIPPGLEAIILRCLSKDPSDRFDSAALLADALGRPLDAAPPLADGVPDTVTMSATALLRPPSPPARSRSRWPLVAVVSLASVVTLAAAVGLTRRGNPNPAPLPPVAATAPVAAPPAPAPVVAPPPPAPAPIAAPPAPAPAVVAAPAPSVVVDAGAPPARRSAHSALSLAQQSFAAGRYQETIAHANDAVAQGGRGALDARVLIGKARNAMGQRAEAVRALRMVLERDPGHRGARQALSAMGESVAP
ncbi:MAG: serine/threonine protein kinase, partial [Deltaproteobacteria bacterium]|nr:serine/threonine protein kinase [Deltaproteobacteria bacterium]